MSFFFFFSNESNFSEVLLEMKISVFLVKQENILFILSLFFPVTQQMFAGYKKPRFVLLEAICFIDEAFIYPFLSPLPLL